MEKKKVLFVVHQLNYGGVQKSLTSALNVLDYSNVDVTMYVRKNRTELLGDINENVSKIIINDDKSRYYRRPFAVLLEFIMFFARKLRMNELVEKIEYKLNEYIVKEKLKYEKKHFFSNEICYDVAVSYIQGYTAKLVADHIQAKKKVVFFHGSKDENHTVHEKIFASFDKIVGVNAGVRDILKTLYPMYSDKITYLENYVDANEIIERSKEFVIKKPDDVPVICSCGRISKEKGYDLAVEAAKILSDKGLKFKWYLVGDGPQRNKIDNMISQYGLSDRVIVTGLKENPYPWILHCDVYVQPSYEEAQPLSIMEAQILNKPVVTTATVGGMNICKDGETGVITEISASGIASGIIRLLNDPGEMNRITENLKKIDYTAEKERYKKQWKAILEQA